MDADEISLSTGIEPAMVPLYLKKLIQSYERKETALEIIRAGVKYALRVKEAYVDRVRALAAPEVPHKLLKTAALIAYHQPVRQSDLVEMYGVKVYDHVKELMSLGLVRARKEGPTKVLTTTHHFSETFGIGSVSKKSVKGHVKERALERIEAVSKATLESFEEEDSAADAVPEGDGSTESGTTDPGQTGQTQ